MTESSHEFGGEWTEEKLERVQKYLVAYATIMNKHRDKFRFAYIDAFAGTGYRTLKREENPEELMFPELAEPEPQQFMDGSARIALQVEPTFDAYIFVEKDDKRYQELKRLQLEFPEHDIRLEQEDANTYLQQLCEKEWKTRRAVAFLDPYGMEVEWKTVEAIAKTQAIDLWLLFPLGVAVNRLLKKDGKIDPVMRNRLDLLFGTSDWYGAFYQTKAQRSLFDDEPELEKVSGFEGIAQYFVSRLKSVFTEVAENPLPLYNSRNNPLFLLCFAAGNPRGAPTAVRIANDIMLKR